MEEKGRHNDKKKLGKFISGLCFLALCFVFLTGITFAQDAPGNVVQLHVEDGKLMDPSGEPVQLRGVSTHGLTWFPDFVNAELFRQLSEDWGASLIRLAMYSDIYTGGEQEESHKLMRKGIDAVVGSGLYVLVDWHILEDGDPNQNIDAAMEFFGKISAEYAGVPNLLYEICNEPNGTTNWGNILEYSRQVIPVIRANSPEAVIIVGTPDYDQNLSSGILRPVPFDNVMYALHFYSATHYEDLFDELVTSVNAGLPVFITECGLSESSGDGKLDFGSAAVWFKYLNENKISYAVWSFSNKNESSALLDPDYDPDHLITDDDLTPAGFWVREVIRGTDPDEIPVPAVVVEKSRIEKLLSMIYGSIGEEGLDVVRDWWKIALGAAVLMILTIILRGGHQGPVKRTDPDL